MPKKKELVPGAPLDVEATLRQYIEMIKEPSLKGPLISQATVIAHNLRERLVAIESPALCNRESLLAECRTEVGKVVTEALARSGHTRYRTRMQFQGTTPRKFDPFFGVRDAKGYTIYQLWDRIEAENLMTGAKVIKMNDRVKAALEAKNVVATGKKSRGEKPASVNITELGTVFEIKGITADAKLMLSNESGATGEPDADPFNYVNIDRLR